MRESTVMGILTSDNFSLVQSYIGQTHAIHVLTTHIAYIAHDRTL